MTMLDELIELATKFREKHEPIAVRIDLNQRTFDWLAERIQVVHNPIDNPLAAHAFGGVPVRVTPIMPDGHAILVMSDGEVRPIRFTERRLDAEEEAQAEEGRGLG